MNGYKETILVDIDETTAETVKDGVYPIVNEEFGTDFSHETTFNCRDVFGKKIVENGQDIDLQRKIQIFNGAVLKDQGTNLISTVEGSVEKILELSSGFQIGMLTARHPMLKEYSAEWVKEKYNGHVGEVLFSNCYHGGKKTKSDICIEKGAKIMIEDDMDYSLELAANGIKVFLLRKPWNERRFEKHYNIERVDSWSDIRL